MSEQNYMSTRAANATIDELREELTAAQQRVVELEQSRDAWEKHYNARVPKLTAEVDRLRELLRECREYVPIDQQDFIDAELAKGE